MRSNLDAQQAMASVNFRRLPRHSHSVAKQASFRVAFGSDLGTFLEAKMDATTRFLSIFFEVILECILASIFLRCLDARDLKNRALAPTGAQFLQNRRFRKSDENGSMLTPFSDAKTTKIRNKIVPQNILFFNINFSAFFR